MEILIASGLIVLFVAASFFFAVSETALFFLSPWQTRRLAEQHPRQGGLVRELLSRPADLLATIVLGNTLANAGITGIAFWMCIQAKWPIVPVLAGAFLLILLGCEVVPKALAVRLPEVWSLRVAAPMLWLQRGALPLQWLGQKLNAMLTPRGAAQAKQAKEMTDDDYRELIEMAYQQGALAVSEKEIILQIIGLDRRTVKEAMRPRSRVAYIADDLSMEEMNAAAIRHKHRRLPMYDAEADTIVGILNTRTFLLDPQADFSESVEFPSFVPDSMNLLKLLQSLQRQQRGMAIVTDEFGGWAGVVTVEDILEEVIGEIRGEGEESGFLMEKLGEGQWRVNGALRQEDFQREYPPLPVAPAVETMAGLVVALAERVPAREEFFDRGNLRFTVLAADERRVKEIRVELLRKTAGGAK
jgi:putative hemolysin